MICYNTFSWHGAMSTNAGDDDKNHFDLYYTNNYQVLNPYLTLFDF